MDADPDLLLVKLCQSGDVSAFNELVCRNKNRIYRLVYRMLGSLNEVDDVAQEIFLRAYRRIDKFKCKSSFSTWLTQIAVNYCTNYLRKQRSYKFLPLGMFSGEWRRSSSQSQATVERDEECQKVYQAVKLLPTKHMAVIILHYFEEYSCEEIAEILNCSIGTVKSRLFHARKELKKRLEPYVKYGKWNDNQSEIGGETYEMFKM